MKSVVVGTAGHIDHGKSALIKALTGIDPDRLEEEKRRGITIDIGFAHLELAAPNGEKLRIAFVDVPGHERFVRNMLAGIGGIDLVLLVIAADESIKPQTREHFDICRLLQISRGMTVLTKSDLVDQETLGVVRLEVEDFLRGSFLDVSRSPIVAISTKTGAGLEELKQQLGRLAAETPPKDAAALFRLPIDRIFSMKGFGTVVTGTLIAGTVLKEEELEVFPLGKRVRVRGIQVHSAHAEQATAGQRTALNLVGATVEDLARGMTLTRPGQLRTTRQLDVSLALLGSAKPLRDRARVHFHAYTSEAIAEVLLYGAKPLQPGETAFARLRLPEPMLLLPGDRFIIRQFSPVITIGGGEVVDSFPLERKVSPQTGSFLQKLSKASDRDLLRSRIERRGRSGLMPSDAVAELGWPPEKIHSLLSSPAAQNGTLVCANTLVSKEAFSAVKADLRSAVTEFHKRQPLAQGISREQLRTRVDAGDEVFNAALDELLQSKQLESDADLIRLPGRGVVLKDEEAESKRRIEQAFAGAGLKVPALQEVLSGLRIDRVVAQKIVSLLLREKQLIKVSEDLVFHRDALENLRRNLVEYKNRSTKIDVAGFKDLTGVSRKYAIPLLEYLDRERVTRRVGDERVIL